MIKTEFILSGEFQENCYIVYDDTSKKAIIIDPGQDGKKVIDKIEKLKLKPELLINTHGHFDHTFSDDIIRQKYNIPLAIHKGDTEMLSDANKNFSTMIGSPTIINEAAQQGAAIVLSLFINLYITKLVYLTKNS